MKLTNYDVYAIGQITKFEAGVIYKASKEGKINVIPQLTKDLYNQVNFDIRMARQRYNQDSRNYDRIYNAVDDILGDNFEAAQEKLDAYIEDMKKRAGKKNIDYGL